MSLQVCGLRLSHTVYYWLALYLRAWLFLYKSKFKKTNTQTPTKFARNWPAMWWYDSHLRHERGGHYTQHRFLWTSFIIEWMNRWKQRKSSDKIWAISSHLRKQQQIKMADRRRIASRAYIQWMINAHYNRYRRRDYKRGNTLVRVEQMQLFNDELAKKKWIKTLS